MLATFTTPPDSIHMPFTGQIVLICLFGAMTTVLFAYAVTVARRTSSPLPLLFFLGGQATVFLEPVADVMGNVIHAQQGQYTVFEVKGHPIPVHVFLCFSWYFGGLPILLFDKIRSQSVPRSLWWKVYFVVGVIVPLIEVIPAQYDIWVYYGQQPWAIGSTPDGMASANVCAVILPALVLYRMVPRLTGWRQLLVVPMIPTFAMGGHAGSGILLYAALGQNTETMSQWVLQGAGLASVALSVLMVWTMLELVYGPSREPVPETVRDTGRGRAESAPSRREEPVPVLSARASIE